MSGRPPELFPLFAELTSLPGVGPKIAASLGQLEIRRPRDLLFHLPQGVIDRMPRESVRDAPMPSVVTVEVTVLAHRPPAARGKPWRVQVEDAGTIFQLVYFHVRGDWLERLLPVGARRVVSGRIEPFDGIVEMVHPDHVVLPGEAATIPRHEPVYPLTAGVGQRQMARAVAAALDRLPSDMGEWIDPSLKLRRGWPDWAEALRRAHAPKGAADLALAAPARERLAYDELFAHQLTLALARLRRRRVRGRETRGTGHLRARVLAALAFELTDAQRRAVEEIAADMAAPHRMHRLLQGDVGSGKTVVAFLALLTAVEAGGQGALMAPTEILARQHMAGLAPLAEAAGVRLELLTGRDRGELRRGKLERLAAGEIDILVGTHALFQQDVAFRDLRLAVVDEQHRFGVRQRLALGSKGRRADVLVMTATPIPRSLALAHYGDMDLSVLDEKPPGRKPVATSVVSDERLDEVVERLSRALAEGRQAYWVCPLVEESETVDLAAAEARFAQLRARLGEAKVGLVHGQMPAEARDAAMADFAAGRTRLLVATTVIEVGVDVPDATIMVIERADSFGLAQLHQLRGRVGRGAGQSSCILLYRPPLSKTAERRLRVMRETEDGFRIAEADLEMRGAGDVLGTAQSGLPRFRVADIESQAGLLVTAQADARALVARDPGLASERGAAARRLLWLLDRDEAIRLMEAG